MHADTAHDNKPGFFSKIFGHHDPAAPIATAANPNIITPDDAVAAGITSGLGDEPTVSAGTSDFMPTSNSQEDALSPADTTSVDAVSPDASNSDQAPRSDTMSDVHTVPSTAHEPLDLSSSPVDAPDAVSDPSDVAPATTPDTSEISERSLVPLHQEVQADLNASLQHIEDPKSEGLMAKTDDIIALNNVLASDHPDPTAVQTEPDPEPSPVQMDATLPVVPESALPSQAPTELEPPAPPVEEGEAWRAKHPDGLEPAIKSVSSELPSASGVSDEHSQDDVSAKPSKDDSNDVSEDRPSPDNKPEADDGQPTQSPTAEVDPVTRAALVRLEGHLDELERGFDKIRDELAKLSR